MRHDAVDERRHGIAVAIEDRRQRVAHAIEQRRLRDHAVLDHFVQAGAEFAARQCFEHHRIGHHQARRVKRADQVLAERVVDAGLAADRAVHLREQRSRHVHHRNAAQVGGRGKADDIADHAAADGDDHRRAIRLGLDQRIEHARHGVEVLVALAVFDQDRRAIRAGFPKPRAVEVPDALARDQQAARAQPGRAHLAWRAHRWCRCR